VYNAANEVCVEAFRTGRLAFVDIVDTVAMLVERHRLERDRRRGLDVGSRQDLTVDDVLAADAWAREQTLNELSRPHHMKAPS
jgi:1-deoxy-D-xylulose-5-phosphate reductoisomerase